jgi:2-haloacid dehalogenase
MVSPVHCHLRRCRPGLHKQREAARSSLGDLLDALGSPEDPDQLTRVQFDCWRHLPLFDDAMGFLSCVQIPVCIVSGIDRADLEAAIDHHRLTFARVVTGEDVRSYKPRPGPFERALELLGVPRDRVLHAGDSLACDVAGANRAGIPVAWVNRSGQRRPPDVTLRAEVVGLTELADLIRSG